LQQRTASNIKGLVALGLADLHCKGIGTKYSNSQRAMEMTEFSVLFNEIEPKKVI